MNLIPFARMVNEMRALQKEFFGTAKADRPPDLVGRARAREKDVDRALREILGAPTLFDREEDENP